ncbi:MAG: tetratricopeptide repeat protein, partial [Blastocatellia bacterium]
AVPPTSVIFYACQIGERAYENAELQHGVFTYYILRGLRELADRPDGRVEAGRLAGYLSENVRKWTKEQSKLPVEQNPTMIATEVRGPVLIARVMPLSAKLPALSATAGLLLSTSPEGALLTINGQQAGRGPLQKELPPNQYTVRAELPGFQPAETKVGLIAGYQQEVTLTLQPIAGNPSYEKGLQFEKQQLWPQAIASYEQALRDDPNSMSVYERLAQAYMKNGRHREAVDLLTVATQKFPDNALILARRSRARSALLSGDEDPPGLITPQITPQSFAPQSGEETGKKAKKSKKKAEETETGEQEKGGKKSKSGKSGKKDSTEETLEDEGGKSGKSGKSGKGSKGSKKDPAGETQGRQLIAGAPVETQEAGKSKDGGAADINEAIRDAELAIQKDDRLAEAHLALGFACLTDEKNYDRALAAFVRASTVAPEEAEAYFGVGHVYRLKQQLQQALPQLKKAVELRPDYY